MEDFGSLGSGGAVKTSEKGKIGLLNIKQKVFSLLNSIFCLSRPCSGTKKYKFGAGFFSFFVPKFFQL